MFSVGGTLDVSKQVEKVFGVWVCLGKKLFKGPKGGRFCPALTPALI